jgi:molybdopterin synthase catalytic subunit
LRERAGTGARELELRDGSRVADVWPALGLGDEPDGLLYAVNRSYDAVVAAVRRDEAGAVATFLGTVRSRSRGRTVLHLEYEAYEGMAEETMAALAAELAQRHDLCAMAIHHRVGRVEIGEPSVAIAVSSPHRADALAACREAIDTLKQSVPLWKKEVYEGGEEWIGQGS